MRRRKIWHVNGRNVVKKNRRGLLFCWILISSMFLSCTGCCALAMFVNGPPTAWERQRLFYRVCADYQVLEALQNNKPVSQYWIEQFISDKRILRDPVSSSILLANPSLDKRKKNFLVAQGYGYSYIDALLNWNRKRVHDIDEDMIEAFLLAVDNDDGQGHAISMAFAGILRTEGYSEATYQKCWQYFKKYCLCYRWVTWFLVRTHKPHRAGVQFHDVELRIILRNKNLPVSIQQEVKLLLETYCPRLKKLHGGDENWVDEWLKAHSSTMLDNPDLD